MSTTTTQTREPETMSDEEFFAARRETMGDRYPGDEEMRRRDAEDDRDMGEWMREQQTSPEPSAAPAQAERSADAAKDWNAHDWLQETFKSDPHFSELSDADRGRLEALAEQKHAEITTEVTDWAKSRTEEWGSDLHDKVVEGLEANASTADFVQTRLADGDFSADDQAALKAAVQDMTPAEQVHLIRPLVEEAHQMKADVIDGVEMILDRSIDDVKDIVDARAEMPNGDTAEVQKLLADLDAAPAQVHEVIDFLRDDDARDFVKVEGAMDAIEAGADPHSLHDTDTWQVDDHADEHAMAEA